MPEEIEDESIADVLADDRIQQQLDPTVAHRLRPSCTGSIDTKYPPRRQLELLGSLRDRGATIGIGSACALDVAAELQRFVATTDAAACAHCGR